MENDPKWKKATKKQVQEDLDQRQEGHAFGDGEDQA
jgi:hypothetical protein